MLVGRQFDLAPVTAKSDASIYDNSNASYVLPNRGNGMNVTTSSLSAIIDTGQALIQGRLVEITEPLTVSIPANSTGFLVIEIDLTKVNSSSGSGDTYQFTNNQLFVKFVNILVQGDLHNGDTLYHLNLGSVTSSANGVTFVKNIDAYSKNTNAWVNIALINGFTLLGIAGSAIARYIVLNNIVYINIHNIVTPSPFNIVTMGIIPIEHTPTHDFVGSAYVYGSTGDNAIIVRAVNGNIDLNMTAPQVSVSFHCTLSYPLN